MELAELTEIINRHGTNLKQEIGLSLSDEECKYIVKSKLSELFSLHVVSDQKELLIDFYLKINNLNPKETKALAIAQVLADAYFKIN